MRGRIALGAALLLLLALSTGGDARPPPVIWNKEQWLDHKHAWRIGPINFPGCPGGSGCRGGGIQSTDDGGRTWRLIVAESGDCCLGSLTGIGVGTLGPIPHGNIDGSGWWTRDDGRHWYESRRIGAVTGGWGPLLFWAGHDRLYRVTPWPPKGAAKCTPLEETVGGRAPRRGTVCKENLDRRLRAVAVPGWSYTESNMPADMQGFPDHVAVVMRCPAAVVVVDAQNHVRTVVPPKSKGVALESIDFTPVEALETGQELVLTGRRSSSGDCYGAGLDDGEVTWRSTEGLFWEGGE